MAMDAGYDGPLYDLFETMRQKLNKALGRPEKAPAPVPTA
jgi:hypothetical protein